MNKTWSSLRPTICVQVCVFVYLSRHIWASLVPQLAKNLPAMWENWGRSLGWEDSLEEGMTTLSSILAWKIPMDRGAWQGYSSWGHKELDMTERLSVHTHVKEMKVKVTQSCPTLCGPMTIQSMAFSRQE